MKISNIFLAGIAGTTAMTVFSYAVSKSKQKNFKEPQLLGEFAENTVANSKKRQSQIIGWIAHYSVGILFAGVYSIVLNRTKAKSTFLNGALYGAISSIPAVLGWGTAFTIHPDPPKTDVKRYSGHLVLAHVVFGIVTFLSFRKR